MSSFMSQKAAGQIRPSQILTNCGVGSIIDLPYLSVLVMGLEDWQIRDSAEIRENRLLQAVQSVMGSQVRQLLQPPIEEGHLGTPVNNPVGVPVATFPRWLVCPFCRLLAPIDTGVFSLRTRYGQASYIHENCSKAHQPVVVPARFMIACDAGHLDDFPWQDFVHRGAQHQNHILALEERGVSVEITEVYVRCTTCGRRYPMSEVFGTQEEKQYPPKCRGRRPHLRDFEREGCTREARPILLGASNLWFPLYFTTLSLPEAPDRLTPLLDRYWENLQDVEDVSEIAFMRRRRFIQDLEDFDDDEIFEGIVQKRSQVVSEKQITPADLKRPEWEILSHPDSVRHTQDFEAYTFAPAGHNKLLEQVVLVERLREVRALTGFTRLESFNGYAEEEEIPKEHLMRLTRKSPIWVPAVETRGEGIFIQFREEAIREWEQREEVRRRDKLFQQAHGQWRMDRRIPEPQQNYPGIRYVLLHTFAHALMRQLTLESGYTTASIRERIYASLPGSEGGPTAGVLLYTAAADSEGTLGGLVSQGNPEQLDWHIAGALEQMQICTSDPLCAQHNFIEDRSLHGATCHACLFVPETSCERGNKYLDRNVLIRTLAEGASIAFFPTPDV